jgi:hypothetical protein
MNNREGDFSPRNILLQIKICLKAFGTNPKLPLVEITAVKHIDLVNRWHIENSIQLKIGYPGLCLLPCFARCALRRSFAVLHKPGWQGPLIFSRLDCAFTQQHFALVVRDTANNYAWVSVVDNFTVRAHETLPIVAIGDLQNHGTTAAATKFHKEIPSPAPGLS